MTKKVNTPLARKRAFNRLLRAMYSSDPVVGFYREALNQRR